MLWPLTEQDVDLYSKSDLKKQLADMRLRPDDTVMVHSSMRSIGEVENRAAGVLDAMMEYFAPGLLVFPTLSYKFIHADAPVFKVNETPSCVGILPELFRQRPGVIRSWHPTHSVAAYGRDAAEFTAGHEKFNTPCDRLSPWGKLVDRRARILFIGTGTSCNTLLHGIEFWMNVPECAYLIPQDLQVETPDGRIIAVPTRRHQGQHWRFYGKPEAFLIEHGAITVGRFGDAVCHVADAAKVAELISQLLRAEPLLFTDDRPLPALNSWSAVGVAHLAVLLLLNNCSESLQFSADLLDLLA